MLLFALDDSPFAAALAAQLGVAIAPHEERVFADGERKLRPRVDPDGADAWVVHGLHGDAADSPHDKLCRLLMFIATLRDHGAARVTALVPYLAYARKDRRTKPFDPLGLRVVAQLLEAVGTTRVITLEVHNLAAFECAFRIPVQSLPAHPAFDAVVDEVAAAGPLAVASPDPGGVKRAQLWREALQARLSRPIGFAMVDKRRSAGEIGGTDLVAGDVNGAQVLLLDDLIASGETIRRAAAALREAGACAVHAFAAHGLFVELASGLFSDPNLAQIVTTDSVTSMYAQAPTTKGPRTVSCAPRFVAAVRRSVDTGLA